MMPLKYLLCSSIAALLLLSCQNTKQPDINFDKEFAFVSSQYDILISETRQVMASNKEQKKNLVSPRTTKGGKLIVNNPREWTTGFFPGSLWYIYEYTKDEKWANEARHFMADIENQKYDKSNHDLGFKFQCSFGNAYRLTKDTTYRNVVITAAHSLATRYYSKPKVIRSWDWNKDRWECPVIIDNMMNLEMLFWVSQETQDSTYYNIAIDHANTTLANHFRDDYSSYHVVDYDTITGDVRLKQTFQGYADESAWARGQAWAIYGYTVCYRFTKDEKYLNQAKNIVDFYFNHPNLPSDLIPYWDFNAPSIPNEERDVSAATVIASALYELSTYNNTNSSQYKKWANTILDNLTENYKAKAGEQKGFLLVHSTGHKPGNSEIDVPLVYADYYYLEALLRKKQLDKAGRLEVN